MPVIHFFFACLCDVHFFFAWPKKKPNQRKKSPAHAKKLKIKACFSKRAKRPRFARLTRLVFNGKHLQFSSRFFAKAGSDCFVSGRVGLTPLRGLFGGIITYRGLRFAHPRLITITAPWLFYFPNTVGPWKHKDENAEGVKEYRQGLSEAQPLIKNMHD